MGERRNRRRACSALRLAIGAEGESLAALHSESDDPPAWGWRNLYHALGAAVLEAAGDVKRPRLTLPVGSITSGSIA